MTPHWPVEHYCKISSYAMQQRDIRAFSVSTGRGKPFTEKCSNQELQPRIILDLILTII